MDYIISSGITSSGLILSEDHLNIEKGGTANSTTIAGAIVEVLSGGTASNTVINASDDHDEEFGWGGVLHVTLQSTKLTLNKKAGVYSADTKTLLLEAGEYYISVESTNAKKGGNAYYNVSLNENSVFFTNGDDGWNNWLYEKKTGPNPDRDDFITMVISSSTEEIQLDRDGDVDSGDWLNFVGYDDAADYAKIVLDGEAKLSFTIHATDAAKFVICKHTEKVSKKGVVTYSKKALQTTKLTKNKQTQLYAANTKALKLGAGEYFISVQSTNAKQGGNAYYRVNLNEERSWFSEAVLDAKVADALECGSMFNLEAGLLAAGLENGLNEKQSTWLEVAKLA